MTFSIVGRCADTGQLGVAICSSTIAVGARCPWLRPGVGAVVVQNITLPALGPQVLDNLEFGVPPAQALDYALTRNGHTPFRQLSAIDHLGRTAHFTGTETLGPHHAVTGEQCVGIGNLLADRAVVDTMLRCFEHTEGHLAERLLAALQAAMAAGGEAGAVHSAALMVVGELTWPLVDLRVDWAAHDPVGQLTQLWAAYQPQMDEYIARALDPAHAPGHRAPGAR